MKIILKRSLWLTVITILCFVVVTLFATVSCDKSEIPPKVYNVDNPLTDLPWLKTKVEEIVLQIQNGNPVSVSIYQCTYGNGQTGFLEDCGNIKYFYNCEGEKLCLMGGFAGATCPELSIDFANEKLIWKAENGFINDSCEFDNPLADLQWLKKIAEDYTAYSNTVSKRHFQIYQCTYVEENSKKIGFIITPICEDCDYGTAMLYKCSGIKLCSMGGILGTCDEFNIADKRLIWEINN